MKRLLALCLALSLILALSACGKSQSTFSHAIDSFPEAPVETPYVDQPAAANVLDAVTPIPPDTGTLELVEQTFDIPQLTVSYTEDMQVAADGDDVVVTSGDGVWTIRFQPFVSIHRTNLINDITNYYISAGEEVFPDRSEAETTLAGFPAHVYARNIHEEYVNHQEEFMVPSVEIILDYGSTLVGKWAGLRVRLTSNDYANYSNIYDVLNLRHVRAVLNNFRVNEGDNGITVSAGGITVTFPSSWDSHDGDVTGPWAGIFENSELIGGVYLQSASPADPREAATQSGDEAFDWSCDGTDYVGRIHNWAGNEDINDYELSLYTAFSNDRCLSVKLMLFAGKEDPSVLREYIETETFQNILRSVALDPAGIPGVFISVDDTGLQRNANGVITGYEGTDPEIEIPTVINGVEIRGIGYSAFAGNTTIKKVTLPVTMEYIDEYAFRNCTSLETVEFGGTQSIGADAFAGCTRLRDVTLPETVTYVGSNNFAELGQGSFTAPGAAKYGSNCFYGSTFEMISIGPGSDLSEGSIFASAKAREIQLGEGIRSIGYGCFAQTTELEKLELPDSVTELGEAAFNETGLQTLRIPEGVTEIHTNTYHCQSGVVMLPASVTRIDILGIVAQVVMLQSTEAELAEGAIDTDVLLLPNVYQREDVSFTMDTSHLYVDLMVFIAMDASIDKSDAFDDYLEENGFGRIAWLGLSPERMRYDPSDFRFEDETVAEYTGTEMDVCIPLLRSDGEYWGWRLGDHLFTGTQVRSVTLHSFVREMGSEVFSGCDTLSDLWFTADLSRCTDEDAYDYAADAFAGIPGGVTVHIPACLTEAERSVAEEYLKSCGLPDTALFDYYSLQ